MIKCVVFSLILSSLLFAEITDTAETAKYYRIVQKDTSYFILSSKKLLRLNTPDFPVSFNYVDEIQGAFSRSTLFSVNNHQLMIKNLDTLYFFSIDSSGAFSLQKKIKDPWSITFVSEALNDFVIVSGNNIKLLTCSSDSIFLKDTLITPYTGQLINFPIFYHARKAYKYVEGFGYYHMYDFTDYFRDQPSLHDKRICFRTWYQPYPNVPPVEASLRARLLAEPDFYVVVDIPMWGISFTDMNLYYGKVIAITSKYVELGPYVGSQGDWIYYRNTNLFIKDDIDSIDYIPFNNFIFKLTPTKIEWSSGSANEFQPLVYNRPVLNMENEIPGKMEFELYQNFPNPFNSATNIKYVIPSASYVSIKIYNLLGAEIAELVNEMKPPGEHEIKFESDQLSSGIYFSVMKADRYLSVKKMILLK